MTKTIRKGLFLDPSGLGTTGGCLVDLDTNEVIKFYQYESDNWLEHLDNLIIFCREEQPEVIGYETTNYISDRNRGAHVTSLFKLFGAIESLRYIIPSIKKTVTELVLVIKNLKDGFLAKNIELKDLSLRKGKGWYHKEQYISEHQLDAYFVYRWLTLDESEKAKYRRIRIAAGKTKYRAKARKKELEKKKNE